ncbi:TRAP transporter large permease [Paenalcaligenes hominis]|uniref:TRAP transporter large permease n=1 Tax=Paenalcaligenes hominis TaxID=643674 RepID=UPI003525C93A
MITGLIIFAFVLLLIALRFPVGIAMFAAGSLGYMYLMDWNIALWLNLLKSIPYARLSNYDLVVIPMFLLMGQFAIHGGLSQSLFNSVSAFIGHRRGGLALASIGACAGFGAICGSSVATAATMSQVALPELKRHNYSDSLATGALAAGGTLGILIPPSVPLIIYGILTQESIGKLFIASVLPGVIAISGYLLVILFMVYRDPSAGPAGVRQSWAVRWVRLLEISPVIFVFLVIIFGIYGGWATPTEAAAIGAAACGFLAWAKGRLTWQGLIQCLLGTAQSSAMVLLILLGADFLNSALALSRMPVELADWVLTLEMSPLLVLAAILIIYIILGCVMDSLAMILLTIPIFYPIVMGIDLFGLSIPEKSIWFGVLSLMVIEIGLITPPVGMNVFIVNKMAKEVSLIESYKGVMPFLLSDLLRIILLASVPAITLYLLNL